MADAGWRVQEAGREAGKGRQQAMRSASASSQRARGPRSTRALSVGPSTPVDIYARPASQLLAMDGPVSCEMGA
jgi:hypothetical protein